MVELGWLFYLLHPRDSNGAAVMNKEELLT